MKKTKVKYVLSEEDYQLVKDIIDDLQDEINNECRMGAIEVLGALKVALSVEE